MRKLSGIYLLLFFLVGCISPKKVDETVLFYESSINVLQDSLDRQHFLTDSLRTALIAARGGNEFLLMAQQQLQDRLLELDDRLEQLTGSLSNTQSNLNERVRQLEQEKAAVESALDELRQNYREIAQRYQGKLDRVAEAFALNADFSSRTTLRARAGTLSVIVQEQELFRNSGNSLAAGTGFLLKTVAEMLEKEPLLELTIIGHTDNRNSYAGQGGARAYSALRAVKLADELTRNHFISANRISAVGMGDAEPLESNATEAGRMVNRRMEFRLNNSVSNLLRELDKAGKSPD